MSKLDNQLSRMKAMMTYGMTNEGKSNAYTSVEYQKQGADGKTYGIVREGTKFYIKISDKINNVLKEDFNYIGGFRNRKDNEYDSYANALKHFDIKMISLKEAKGNSKLMVESWNPEKNEMMAVEATASMKREIERQRQIMGNAAIISEGTRNYNVNLNEACENVDKDCKCIEKNNMKGEKKHDTCGDVTCNGGDPFTKDADAEFKNTQKNNIGNGEKPVTESEQVLGWNDNDDYLDTTHGTEIGDTAPFNEEPNTNKKELDNGTVEEGVAMHAQGDNQNSPAVGVGEIGDDAPFEEKAKNELQENSFFHNDNFADDEQLSDTPDEIRLEGDDMDEFDGEEDGGELFDDEEGEEEIDFEDESTEDDESEMFEDESDVDAKISEIYDMLEKIAAKIGVDLFDDDKLYDDDETDGKEDDFEDDYEFEDEDDYEVFESKGYREMMMNEEKLDYFGKHPAYQKEPMEVPTNKHQEKEGYYDMNDDSVKNEKPYGEKIGDTAPFNIDPQAIENAITESILNLFKKKI